jgi:hypothetical protein
MREGGAAGVREVKIMKARRQLLLLGMWTVGIVLMLSSLASLTAGAPAAGDTTKLPVRAQAGNTMIELAWEPPGDLQVSGYRVYRADADRPIHGEPILMTPRFLDIGLSNGRAYTYIIRAVLADGTEWDGYQRVTTTPGGDVPAPGAVKRSSVLLDVAAWVPKLDPNHGWWGVMLTGEGPDKPGERSRDTTATLQVVPGQYDVYWKQSYPHAPLRLARAIEVQPGQLTTVEAQAGLRLHVASWVPQLDPNYGWWGVVQAGAAPDTPVHWGRAAATDKLLLPPGSYDVYWKQSYPHAPLRLARAIEVQPGQLTTVEAQSGIQLRLPADTPALDPNYGWWGVVAAGGEPKDRLHWSADASRPLLVPPGTYDILWKQNYPQQPKRIKQGVAVPPNKLVEVDTRRYVLTHPLGVLGMDASVVAKFEFNGNVLDSSGNGNHARLIGGQFIQTSGRQSLHVTGPAPAGLDWSDHANLLVHPYTIEIVLTPRATAPWGKLFGFDDANDNGWYYKSQGIQVYPHAVLGSGEVRGNERHYLAFVSTDPSTVAVYFQGKYLGTTKASFKAPPPQAIFFRDDSRTNRSEQIDAVVEEVRISKVARTSEEIAAVQQMFIP